MLKDETLYAKLRKNFRNGNIPHYILNEDPPQFRQVTNHFNEAHIRYKLDDERVKFHNIPSLFVYIKPQIIEIIGIHPNTKVGLSVHVWMINRTSGTIREMKKRLYTEIKFENYRGTDPETVFDAMREVIFEQVQLLEDVEGSDWALTSIDSVNISFSEITDSVGGSSYKPIPKELVNIMDGIVNVDNRKDNDQQCFK